MGIRTDFDRLQNMTEDIRHFAADFPVADQAKWRDMAEGALRGADFDEALVKRSEDGIELGPLFTKQNTYNTQFVCRNHRPVGGPWHIGAHVNNPDINTSNTDILADLNGGASLILIDAGHDSPFGVDLRAKTDMQRLLAGVHIDLAPVALIPSDRNFASAAVLAAHFLSEKKLKETEVSLGYAPVGDEQNQLISLARWVNENAPQWQAISVNARFAHEAGGSAGQELAFMLALGNHYIRLLLDAGFDIETGLALMNVYLSVDQNGHRNIVKLRAARMLWAKLTESFGAGKSSRACRLNVISSERMMSKMDPWSNMLRLNSAGFGAICGGVDSVTLLPFTYALGLPTGFARRMSINIQNLMNEESHLGQVDDPAHGSFMHEALSLRLAERAWEIFQDIEAHGGWQSPVAKHWFVSELEKTRNERAEKIQSGKIELIGVNQFVKTDVRPAKVRRAPTLKTRKGDIINATDFAEAVAQANQGHLAPAFADPPLIRKTRLSEPFENAGGSS